MHSARAARQPQAKRSLHLQPQLKQWLDQRISDIKQRVEPASIRQIVYAGAWGVLSTIWSSPRILLGKNALDRRGTPGCSLRRVELHFSISTKAASPSS
eukprot:6183931-Pleurochrysis_carterae.AAC.2